MSIARFAIAVLLMLAGASANAGSVAAVLPAPVDLQHDARQAEREGKPIVLMFSLPGCRFCQVVRQNYLAPLLRGLPTQERPIIREIEITSGEDFVGFDGVRISHQDLARKLNIRFAPSVAFFGPSGQFLAEPIVGGDVAGLYGGVLENAFGEAAQKLASLRPNNSTGEKR